jgi:hypothetical protein
LAVNALLCKPIQSRLLWGWAYLEGFVHYHVAINIGSLIMHVINGAQLVAIYEFFHRLLAENEPDPAGPELFVCLPSFHARNPPYSNHPRQLSALSFCSDGIIDPRLPPQRVGIRNCPFPPN